MTYIEALAVQCGVDTLDGALVIGQVVTVDTVVLTVEGGQEHTFTKEGE